MKTLLLLIAMLAVPTFAQTPAIEPGVSQELAKWRAARYSDVQYKLNLTLEKMSPVLKGTIEIRVKVSPLPRGTHFGEGVSTSINGQTSVPPIILDWRKVRGHEEKSTISNVKINGRSADALVRMSVASTRTGTGNSENSTGSENVAGGTGNADKGVRVTFEEYNDHLIFRDGVVVGENVIRLDFTSPILTSGSAVTRYIDKEDGSEYIYSLFVPSDASTAFPVFDQPDIKARFSLSIVAPLEWKIVSNENSIERVELFSSTAANVERTPDGNIKETVKIDSGMSVFRMTQSISTYVFAFAAGPFEKYGAGTLLSPPAQRVGKDASPQATIEDKSVLAPSVSGSTRPVQPAMANGLRRPIGTSGTPSNSTHRSMEGRFTPVLYSSQGSGGKPAFLTEMGDADAVTTDGYNNSIQQSATAGGTDIGGAIYVRTSQAAKFKPHAAEVFRLNREAIKFFEQYFDYKFPFPKYDIVLIPEFPFGGMEHAGATFLRESSIIFPQEPTQNDHISRAVLIFHEAAHQWFGDTVTMRWFDDLWLKEGFANFAAYKALEKIMPEANAWKVFYERVKQAAYRTDSTKGTTPIYQEIKNLSSAKSAYGNIVYNKAPAFLRQAEFYLGEENFQTGVRSFLKKHEFGNAGWEDLLAEFERNSINVFWKRDGFSQKEWTQRTLEFEKESAGKLANFASFWIKQPGVLKVGFEEAISTSGPANILEAKVRPSQDLRVQLNDGNNLMRIEVLVGTPDGKRQSMGYGILAPDSRRHAERPSQVSFVFPNYGDYGYGIFLLDEESRDYVLKNIQNEKDPFLRSMMWGALWDSVREGELDPREYVELVVKVLASAKTENRPVAEAATPLLGKEGSRIIDDESTTALLLNRVVTALNYYIDEPPPALTDKRPAAIANARASVSTGLRTRVEDMLAERLQNAPTQGQRITYYRAFLNVASSDRSRAVLKDIFTGDLGEGGSNTKMRPGVTSIGGKVVRAGNPAIPVKPKDKFDIAARLIVLGDPDGLNLLAELERSHTSDDAKRWAYAARAGIATAENKAKYWNDLVNNKEISESWIEAAFGTWNSIEHSKLTLPYLERALKELPNHKANRKIFFVNGWLGAFIGGQRSEAALNIINKFLADNSALDKDLRLKILENADVIERAVLIKERSEMKK